MANLLYVTCNLRSQTRSHTLSLGNEFLEEYLRCNPRDEVQVLDLYRDSIPRFDEDLLNAWGRINRADDFLILSDIERRKISRVWRLADQFSLCAKYVFVTHSINLWFPAEFKMYIDTICVPNRTYHLTPNGAERKLNGLGRKSLHLHAGPSFPFQGVQDMSAGYLRSVLGFLGVEDQETVLLQGDDPEQGAKEEYEAVRRGLLTLAQRF